MSAISNRAAKTLAVDCPLNKAFMQVNGKLHHPEFNPQGALNLGLAHNDLLHEKVFAKCQQCLEIVPNDVNYGAPQGSKRLLDLLQAFFTRHFKPYYPLEAEHIFTQTGAGASVNQLIMSIADEGDYCMLPGPYYGAFDLDISVNTGVNIVEVFPHGISDTSINGDELERVYQLAKREGKRITSILITNPDNPLGRCYSRQDIETFLKFASKHSLHYISDEIYALSSFSHLLDTSRQDPFHSILSIGYRDFIDPNLVHVIYGMSKDFAINGFRVGFIITQFNEPLRLALMRSAGFTYTSTIMDRLLSNLFSDEIWIDEYLQENRQMLAEAYTKTTQFLTKHNIDFIPGEAGPFLMIDVRSIIRRKRNRKATFEDETQLWHNMITHGVYLAMSSVFHTRDPGFFRLTFALPWETLEHGLNLVLKSLE
ncbi:aminotransferase [Mucor ambiguus]|uniref:Aminotransferase n=1 Tax=Mucor ambiguus TaxID=91626 RepID=A0A0C9N2T5_9FUNG|nr:aminotransferase [Mucor ambiguus]